MEIAPGSRIAFQAITPLTDTIIKSHIRHSLTLGLPEVDGGDLPAINIVANGPSARGAVFPGMTMALNGAINLFRESPPTIWAGCDPQAALADFLVSPSRDTTYFVASKCHPDVFKALEGFDVRLWHISDQEVPNVRTVPCAVSVTLCAMMLMHRLGYRKLDIWGWDCSYGLNGEHHAAESVEPGADKIDILVGDRTFKTNHTWACEVNDAMGIIPVLEWCGTEINIHGDGMLAAIRQYRAPEGDKVAA